MARLLSLREEASSPVAARAVQSKFTSVEEAERDAIVVYYGSLTNRALAGALVALSFLFVMGYGAVNARGIVMAAEFQWGGAAVLAFCALGLAYLVFDYVRKQRVFILEDSFAVEPRLSSEVELVRWADVAKLYCLDRTRETTVSVLFVPVATRKAHEGKLRIVLVDGRQIVLTNRVRDFSAMAAQFVGRTTAAQLAPCTKFLMEGGALDFDRFGLTSEGLVYKGKLLGWESIQQMSVDRRGTLVFKTGKLWRAPRFSTNALPNASLLLKLLGMFGGEVCPG